VKQEPYEHEPRRVYVIDEDELHEKLGLPDDFSILMITGTGPFRIIEFNGSTIDKQVRK
jgi:hypothetical protein